MTIATGDRLPEATLTQIGAKGPEQVALGDLLKGRKVVIFAVPGAYTPTCHSAHVPSFVRTAEELAQKGVEKIVCLSVNDPFVMRAWGDATGASTAGIAMLADVDGSFTRAIGQAIEGVGGWVEGRSKRYAMLVEDGVVTVFHPELGRGVCETSSGEAMLAAMA